MSGLEPTYYESFLTLFQENQEKVFGFAYSYLRDKAEAEDVVMESMIALWKTETAGRKPVTCMPCC